MTVRIFGMTNGMEIIGNVDESHDDVNTYFVKKPLMVRGQQRGETEYVVMLVPFCISNPEGNFVVHKHAIAFECDAPADTEQAYIQQTTTIQLVSSI